MQSHVVMLITFGQRKNFTSGLIRFKTWLRKVRRPVFAGQQGFDNIWKAFWSYVTVTQILTHEYQEK